MMKLKSCMDNSCIFGHTGMGTNGGCRCLENLEMTPEGARLPESRATKRRIRENIYQLRDRVAALEGEVEAWKDASGLESGGDPDGVTPEAMRKYWEGIEKAQTPRDMSEAPEMEWVYLLIKARSRSRNGVLWLNSDNNFITSPRAGWVPYTPTPDAGDTMHDCEYINPEAVEKE